MAAIVARHMHSDGKYHYGASVVSAPHLGPLYRIITTGDGEIPAAAPNPATPEEHDQWIQSWRDNGFTVQVVSVEEPRD